MNLPTLLIVAGTNLFILGALVFLIQCERVSHQKTLDRLMEITGTLQGYQARQQEREDAVDDLCWVDEDGQVHQLQRNRSTTEETEGTFG